MVDAGLAAGDGAAAGTGSATAASAPTADRTPFVAGRRGSTCPLACSFSSIENSCQTAVKEKEKKKSSDRIVAATERKEIGENNLRREFEARQRVDEVSVTHVR